MDDKKETDVNDTDEEDLVEVSDDEDENGDSLRFKLKVPKRMLKSVTNGNVL
jgi:hypothetical protein